ncbi:MAG TPA: hypothetical protein PLI27_06480 [Ignavibacteriales bacterium]|nr:hypothetical protein [Ignavibacteriales bacterium]HPD67705.1 hypothetical protein [Ignavibacteriales bacterium]HRR19192.1 hypothetical protein [Ignavibacteriales bacterium]HRT98655.1 hypothetical protein [Ignavibacteriales bacterium]
MVTIEEIKKKLICSTTFIIGNEKNAGKTTLLNLLLNHTREVVAPAYLSIGIDGEKTDAVYGNLKPRIEAKVNDFVITTDSQITPANFEIIHIFPFNNVFGKIVLAKNKRNCFVELIGPESNSQLKHILETLKNQFNINTIFIDGAVNRLTQLNALEGSQFIAVFNLTPKNYLTSIDKIKLLCWASTLNKWDIKQSTDKTFFVDGALTTSKISQISPDTETIVLEDITKLFLSYSDISKIKNKFNFFLKHKHNLLGFTLNIKDINIQKLQQDIAALENNFNFIINPFMMLN